MFIANRVKENIFQIRYKTDDDSFKKIGTGFFITQNALFITAKHVTDGRDLDKCSIYYGNGNYNFKRVDNICTLPEIDIVVYKAYIKKDVNYIRIKEIKPSSIKGDVLVAGFPSIDDRIKESKLHIYDCQDDIFQISESSQDILNGCSGSPIFLSPKSEEEPLTLIGMMSYTRNKGKNIHHIFCINFIQKLGYYFDDFKEEISTTYLTNSSLDSLCAIPTNDKKNRLENFNNLFDFISILHNDFEHTIIEEENNLLKSLAYPDIPYHETAILHILVAIKKIIDLLAGDVAVHIKMPKIQTNLGKPVFETLIRLPSARESKGIPRREDSELFLISKINNIPKLQSEEKYKVNSAYNEACFSSYNYWICNNLPLAKENEKYYSSSVGYETFYNSLVVFPIHNKTTSSNIDNIKGLLIIDSIDVNCFQTEYIREIGGYITHRVNRFLNHVYFDEILKKD